MTERILIGENAIAFDREVRTVRDLDWPIQATNPGHTGVNQSHAHTLPGHIPTRTVVLGPHSADPDGPSHRVKRARILFGGVLAVGVLGHGVSRGVTPLAPAEPGNGYVAALNARALIVS